MSGTELPPEVKAFLATLGSIEQLDALALLCEQPSDAPRSLPWLASALAVEVREARRLIEELEAQRVLDRAGPGWALRAHDPPGATARSLVALYRARDTRPLVMRELAELAMERLGRTPPWSGPPGRDRK